MFEIDKMLELTKTIATKAGLRILENLDQNAKIYTFNHKHPKEIKALADTVLEKDILKALIPTGLSILSEESGYISDQRESKYWFIVDPLDGTFNFVKGLGPCAISIALWQDRQPIFGVIYSLMDRQLFWGGIGIGSFCEGQKILVSDTLSKAEASICTGFPARFECENDLVTQAFCHKIGKYAKIRMLGSAAMSLVSVAKGAADVYSEQNIMLWDVAAGLAIVEGAGGSVNFDSGTIEYSLDVYASNKNLYELD